MRTPNPSLRRLALAGAAAAALVLLPAMPAAAHDALSSADPAAGSVVTAAPAAVTLTFTAAPLELGGGRNGIQITDAAGRHYETACAGVSGTSLATPVRLGAAGTYTVTWRAVSSDGHGIGDAYAFRYRPTAGAAAAQGSADGPSCGVAAEAPPQRAAGLPGGALLVGGISGALLLAVVAAVLVVVLRLRRGDPQEADR